MLYWFNEYNRFVSYRNGLAFNLNSQVDISQCETKIVIFFSISRFSFLHAPVVG